MSEVHKAHQSHRHRQADRGDEQEHGIGQAVEQNTDGYDGKMRHEPSPTFKKTPPRHLCAAAPFSVKSKKSGTAAADLLDLALVLDLLGGAHDLDAQLAVRL